MSIKTEEFKKITCYESDYRGKILPTAAMNYFQELSTHQSDVLGVGSEFLSERNIAWFLVKYHLRFEQYPSYKETIKVTTQATSMDKFCGNRRFTIENKNNKEIVIAKTQWLLVHRDSQKMQRIGNYPEFNVYECFEKEPPLFKKVSRLERPHLEKIFNVRFLDIDFNHHVNHVKYLAWAIEVLPIEVIKKRALKEAKIIYKAQGFYGDQVKARGEELEVDHFRVDIVNQQEVLLCQLELWMG